MHEFKMMIETVIKMSNVWKILVNINFILSITTLFTEVATDHPLSTHTICKIISKAVDKTWINILFLKQAAEV